MKVTIGISTRKAPESIIKTVASIMACDGSQPCNVLIVADEVDKSIAEKLTKLSPTIEIIENKKSLSLATKLRQLIKFSKGEVFVFTQDDLLFDKAAINEILAAFEKDPNLTMANMHVEPMEATSFVEKSIAVGSFITHTTGRMWRDGDNYLLANGRGQAFKKSFIEQFSIPDGLVNLDAFLYFENKRHGGVFRYLPNSIIFNKTPSNIVEHLKPSSRFQYSQQELYEYVKKYNLVEEYRVPSILKLKALMIQFIKQPLETIFYLAIFVFTRLKKLKPAVSLNPLWVEESSTKNI